MNAKIYPLTKLNSEIKVSAAPFCLMLEIICASIASGTTTIKNIVSSNEIDTTISWCRQIGATIKVGTDKILVKGVANSISFKNSLFVCGNTSTTAKLMIFLLCSVFQPFGIKASEDILEELKQYYYIFDAYEVKHYLEDDVLRFERKMKAKEVELNCDLDIEIASGILMALPLLNGNSTFKLRAPVRSGKTYSTILKILKKFSIDIKHPATMRYEINGNQKYRRCVITTEKDTFQLSHVALLSTLLKDNESINLNNYRAGSTMDEVKLLDFIRKNVVEYKYYLFKRCFKKKEFSFTTLDASIENSLPLLMVLSTINNKTTIINKVDFAKKRVKKQFDIMQKAFNKLSLDVSESDSEISITPCKVSKKKQVECLSDPYVVIALSILALLSEFPIIIKNIDCIFDKYADFFEDLKQIGAKVEFIHN